MPNWRVRLFCWVTSLLLAIQSTQPKVGIKLASLKNPHHPQDQIDVRCKRYHIIEYQGDGQGGAELYLHEMALSEEIQ